MWVVVLLAEGVRFRVLAREVKDVDSETDVFEDWIVLDHLAKSTIVVKENVVGHEPFNAVGANNHFLCEHTQSVD